MVSERNREVLQQILELTDTACQASLELLELYAGGELESALALLSDLRSVVRAVSGAQEPLMPELEHAYTAEMLENVVDTLDDIECSIQKDDPERAAMLMEFQLFPFLRQLKEAFYFWGMIYPDPKEMARYYREEFAGHYRNLYVDGENPPKYRASVVVVAYNHLEMTKQCVESVLKYTDFEKLNAQLILVDHGSSDGVRDYFESLGAGRVIHYKANMRGTMFCALPQICDSEYYVHVANDTVVTKDWLEILLNCADSDPKIAAAVPATCNISNYQSANVPASDCDTLIKLAEEHNRSDPRLWNDRVRVLPAIGLFRVSTLNEIGFWDPMFYTFDYMDDDFSLRARRQGYRQILCGDVMCYHRGSATVKDAQAAEDTLVVGRRLFLQKHGVDAWGNGCYYDYYGVQQMCQYLPTQGDAAMLALDCGMGDTPLQIRNELRRRDQGCQIYQLTSQEEYLPDLRPFFQEVLCTPRLTAGVGQAFEGVGFSCVYLGRDIGTYEDCDRLLESVSNRLVKGGLFVFSCANPFYALTLHKLFNFSVPEGRCILTDAERLGQKAQTYFSQVRALAVNQPVEGLEQFTKRYFGETEQLPQIIERLRVAKYYFVCIK